MSSVNITIRMDEELKNEADALFSELGLSLTSAITVFVRQAVREQKIPFEITRDVSKTDVSEILRAVLNAEKN